MKDMTPEKKYDIQWHSMDNFLNSIPINIQEEDGELIELADFLEENAMEENNPVARERVDKEFSKWLEDETFRSRFESGELDNPFV